MSHKNKDSSMQVPKSKPGKRKTKMGSKTKKEDAGRAGHRTEDFEFFYSKFSPFSQHYACKFTVKGIEFNCAEQYMMYQKAVVFKDDLYADLIKKTDNPTQQKKYGRKVRNFVPDVWKEKSIRVVEEANYAKFSQNPDIEATLKKTYPRELVEASPRDRLWGIGLGMHNPKARDKKKWRGSNQLGEILTRVRNRLLEEDEGVSRKKMKLMEETKPEFERSSTSCPGFGNAVKDGGVGGEKIKYDPSMERTKTTSKGSKTSHVIDRAPNDKKTVSKDFKEKHISGKKRKSENDNDFQSSKKQKLSGKRETTKKEDTKYEWVEKTMVDEESDGGEKLDIEGNGMNTHRRDDKEDKREKKKEKKRERRRKSKERKREQKRDKEEKMKEENKEEKKKDIKEGKTKEDINEEKKKDIKEEKTKEDIKGEKKKDIKEEKTKEDMKEEKRKGDDGLVQNKEKRNEEKRNEPKDPKQMFEIKRTEERNNERQENKMELD